MHRKLRGTLLFALAGVLLLGAFGCQPNPTVPPVVGKGNLTITDKTPGPSASGAAATASSLAPQRVQQTFQDGKISVVIDADVSLPGADNLPVIKVAPRKFTQEEATKVIQTLFQGKQAYKRKDKMSKSELEKELVYMQAQKSQVSGPNKDKILEKLNAGIQSMQEQLKTAPDTVPLVPSDGKFNTDELGGQEINVISPLGKQGDASLDIYNSKSARTCSISFSNGDQGLSYLGNEVKLSGQPRGVKMTVDEAKALAEKAVADVGSDLKLANVSIGMRRGGGIVNTVNDPDAPQCFLFAFTREVNGVSSTYEEDVGGNLPQKDLDRASASGQYAEPHPYERIEIAVDDTGILEFQWLSPDKVVGTVSDSVETLPFDTIMDTFQQQFFLHNALPGKADATPAKGEGGENFDVGDYAKNQRDAGIYTFDSIGYADDVKSCTFHIDRITLGLSRIAQKDKPDEFLTVPVWDFFGTISVEYTQESGYKGFATTDANKSFLTVNAIDGSIINRPYGY